MSSYVTAMEIAPPIGSRPRKLREVSFCYLAARSWSTLLTSSKPV